MNAKEYLSYLHDFPCVICWALFGKEKMPVQVHHLESVRDKHSDFAAIPICVEHHSELHQLSRRGFARRYGLDDVDMLKHTIRLLMK